jgi:Flp pilus assembly protein TadB
VSGQQRDEPQVYRISGAPRSLKDDQDQRIRRYLLSMVLRTVCFVGAVVSWVVLDQVVVAWLLLVGALLLPYFAVVIANAGRERRRTPPTTTLFTPGAQLPPGAEAPLDANGDGRGP